jgi:hypothetical protein
MQLPKLSESKMKLRPPKGEYKHKSHSYFSVVIQKLDGEKYLVSDFEHNIFPNAALDYIHNMAFVDDVASKIGFVYMALTADTTQTLNSAVTALTGEITTNGLARVKAVTRTHVNGSNTTLVEHTFTLSGSQSDITRAALFNVGTAPVSGTIGPVAAFSNGATGAMVSGETVKVSITITIT